MTQVKVYKQFLPKPRSLYIILPVALSPGLRLNWREWSINYFQAGRISSCKACRSCSTPWSMTKLHTIVCKGNWVNKCRQIINPSCLQK